MSENTAKSLFDDLLRKEDYYQLLSAALLNYSTSEEFVSDKDWKEKVEKLRACHCRLMELIKQTKPD